MSEINELNIAFSGQFIITIRQLLYFVEFQMKFLNYNRTYMADIQQKGDFWSLSWVIVGGQVQWSQTI